MSRLFQQPRHVAITGGSRGIGAALAHAFAAPGRRLSLCSRDVGRLTEIASQCRKRGATVEIQSVDVTIGEDCEAWISTIHAQQPIDLLIVNAGHFDGNGPEGALETAEEAETIISVNLLGAIFTAQAAVPHMLARGRGHIAFLSSLAAYLPLADAPSYSASKAAVTAYAAALREQHIDSGLTITTISPGHVATGQVARHVGRTPMIISPEEASDRIIRGLSRGKTHIDFPRRAYLLTRLASWLPWRLRAAATKSDRFYCRKLDANNNPPNG